MSHPDNGVLTDDDIFEIRNSITRLRKEKNVINRDVQDDIFSLLKNECKILYYPINDAKLWAFYQIDRYPDGTPRKFVFINTNLPYEKQLFAAAHELAHIWQIANDSSEILISSSDDEDPLSKDEVNSDMPSKKELIANRFAAEFLMDADTVKKLYAELVAKETKHPTELRQIALILVLMDHYIAPYKMTVLRLAELKLISSQDSKKFLGIPRVGEQSIQTLQERLGLCKRNSMITRLKQFDNFIDLAIQDYQKELLTFSKLKQLLVMFDTTPETMGISDENVSDFFTSEEMDKLLEDE